MLSHLEESDFSKGGFTFFDCNMLKTTNLLPQK